LIFGRNLVKYVVGREVSFEQEDLPLGSRRHRVFCCKRNTLGTAERRAERATPKARSCARRGVPTPILLIASRLRVPRVHISVYITVFADRCTIDACADKATASETWHGHLAHGASRATPAAWCHVRAHARRGFWAHQTAQGLFHCPSNAP
jgi:hypothetical protein